MFKRKSRRDMVSKTLLSYNKIWKMEKIINNKLIAKILNTNGKFNIIPPFICETGNIKLGDNVYINLGCTILDGNGNVEIGDNVMIGPNVQIYVATHLIDENNKVARDTTWGDVKIGNNVWIGGSSTICSGVTIGDNSVIGAGSVVVKDIPSNAIAVGVPCKPIKISSRENNLIL